MEIKAGHFFLVTCLVIVIFSCTPTSQSTDKQAKDLNHCDTSAIAAKSLDSKSKANSEVLARIQLPETVLYIGLSEPQDVSNTFTKANIPAGMVLIPAGKVHIGSKIGFAHELPRFWAKVSAFLMDKSPVTVAQFRVFVRATSFITEAEKFGNAGVITEDSQNKWILLDGANWEYPLGKDKPKAPDKHPVTQVSWNDATAYAKWAGKRLPSEIEWEHAARNAQNTQTKFPWGDEIQENGKYKANVWQGKFPLKNLLTDTYPYTSPVGVFGKTPLGLTDMTGNVWEWMANRKFDYASLFVSDASTHVISEEYAQRGGSFLCEPSWCEGYRVSGRSSSSPETSLFHVGFRCVKDLK